MEDKKQTHHGQFLKNLVARSEKTISEVMDHSGYSRSSIYRWFEEEKLDMEKIHRIAVACGVDTTGELEELDYYRKTRVKEEPKEKPNNENLISQKKYVELLEQLNEARQQVSDYQGKYFRLKERVTKLEQQKESKD